MANKATFEVSGVTQSAKQAVSGICSIGLVAKGGVSLFGSSSSTESLTITRTVKDAAGLAALQAQFPVGTTVEGYKTRKPIKAWENTSGRVIRHRLYLSNDEQEHLRDEAATDAAYAAALPVVAAGTPAPASITEALGALENA